MNFCSDCGGQVSKKMPAGDTRLRYVCSSCDVIHYQNPRLIVGTLPISGDKVLLCRRAIEPRRGFWTLPAGFMENGETSLEGALRETWEEAEAKLSDEALYQLFDLPHINQVYVFYRGVLQDDKYGCGIESLDVLLFDEKDIPWDEIAFPIITDLLKTFFVDRKTANYPIRVSEIKRRWDGKV